MQRNCMYLELCGGYNNIWFDFNSSVVWLDFDLIMIRHAFDVHSTAYKTLLR